MVVSTNIAATEASNYLNQNNMGLNSAIQELASGSRLANPSTDAAGVAVSGSLTAAITRLGAASNAVNVMVNFAQTADGFLSTIQSQLTRMSELSQEATNGAFGSSDLANYQTEFSILQTQITAVATNASFNGQSIFTANTISVAINAQGALDTLVLSSIGTAASLGISGLSVSTTAAAVTALSAINSAISCITTRRAEVNASISKFNFYLTNINTEQTNLTAANSTISDADVATESTQLSKYNILVQSATAELAQANSVQSAVLSLLK